MSTDAGRDQRVYKPACSGPSHIRRVSTSWSSSLSSKCPRGSDLTLRESHPLAGQVLALMIRTHSARDLSGDALAREVAQADTEDLLQRHMLRVLNSARDLAGAVDRTIGTQGQADVRRTTTGA